MSNGNGSKLTTRKFILTSAAMGLTFLALFMSKLTGAETVQLVSLQLAIFVGGNVWAKHKSFSEAS